MTYRMFLPSGEPVRAAVTEKQKGPDRQRASRANDEADGEDDDD